jgi:parallel beta-helix repeat protein
MSNWWNKAHARLAIRVVSIIGMLAGLFQTYGLSFDEKKNKFLLDTDAVITYNVLLPEGKSLVIKPGVRVIFDGYHSLTVRGLIIAEGTEDRPIIFTALDRPSGSQEPPEWKGIEIVGAAATGRFKHCRFEGAYRNLAWASNPTFDSCDFAGNHYGIYCADNAAPHLLSCRFFRNTYGVAVDHAIPILTDNTITENSIGVYLQLCSETIAGKNVITGNKTNIRSENAFGKNKALFSLQKMWDLMQQLY